MKIVDTCYIIPLHFQDHPTISPSSPKNEPKETDHQALSTLPLDEDIDGIYQDYSNRATNSPVVGGDITYGTSTRGGKMIYMNFYGYIKLHMNETIDFLG